MRQETKLAPGGRLEKLTLVNSKKAQGYIKGTGVDSQIQNENTSSNTQVLSERVRFLQKQKQMAHRRMEHLLRQK